MNKLFFLLPVLGLFFFASCEEENNDDSSTPKANVLVTHASPDAPGVDLLLDDAVVNASPLNFPNNTGYLEIDAGTRNVKVNAAGTSTSVINANLDFMEGKNYSIFAADTLDNIMAVAFEDDLTAPATGQAHIRFIHLSPDAPAVDITVPAAGLTVFSDVAFKEGSAFTPVAAGSYDLDVVVSGTSTVALSVPGVTLEEGKIYTVWASGRLSDNSLGAQIIVNN